MSFETLPAGSLVRGLVARRKIFRHKDDNAFNIDRHNSQPLWYIF